MMASTYLVYRDIASRAVVSHERDVNEGDERGQTERKRLG